MRSLCLELQRWAEVILELGTPGPVLNIIVLWNSIYIDAVLVRLRQESYSVRMKMSRGCRPSFMSGT